MSDDMTAFGWLVAKRLSGAAVLDVRDAQLARYCATIDAQREEIATLQGLIKVVENIAADRDAQVDEVARLTAERDRAYATIFACRYELDATDPGPVLVAETRAAMADDAEQPATVNEAEKRINDIISDIPHMSKPNRTRIRGALDKSEKPLEGRAADDAGLGRAIGRSAREPFSIGW